MQVGRDPGVDGHGAVLARCGFHAVAQQVEFCIVGKAGQGQEFGDPEAGVAEHEHGVGVGETFGGKLLDPL